MEPEGEGEGEGGGPQIGENGRPVSGERTISRDGLRSC